MNIQKDEILQVQIFTGEVFQGIPSEIVHQIHMSSRFPWPSDEAFMAQWATRINPLLSKSTSVLLDPTTPESFVQTNLEAGIMRKVVLS